METPYFELLSKPEEVLMNDDPRKSFFTNPIISVKEFHAISDNTGTHMSTFIHKKLHGVHTSPKQNVSSFALAAFVKGWKRHNIKVMKPAKYSL